MRINNAPIYRRRRLIAFVVIPAAILTLLLTYATRDVCWVGNMPGNHLGYGSCTKMIDTVIGGNR